MSAIRRSRREFLTTVSKGFAGFGLSSAVLDLYVANLFNRALAQSRSQEIYYIHMSFPGGPPRWTFDLPLRPQPGMPFSPGKLGTVITKTLSGYSLDYMTKSYRVAPSETVELPPVWFMGPNGRNFKSLLPNTLMIRGLDMEVNSHPVSNARQTATNIGGLSITGVTADVTGKPLPSVIEGGSQAAKVFKSSKGLAPIFFNAGQTNPATSMLRAFRSLPTSASFAGAEWAGARDQALAKFEDYAISRGLSSTALKDAYANALTLINKGTYEVRNQYPALDEKYRAFMLEALLPKVGELSEYFPNNFRANSSLPEFNFSETGSLANNFDMWQILSDPGLSLIGMAGNFAIAELMINNGLSSSLALNFAGWANCETGRGLAGLEHDQHFTGSLVATFGTTLYYRAFLNCLLEFKEKLGAKFDKSVIHISSEWNRSPSPKGDGSNHGVEGSNVTIMSGMIPEYTLLGNVLSFDNPDQKVTWGVGAPWNHGTESRQLVVTDVTRTITSMLGVKDIVNNGYSLMIPDIARAGKWKPKRKEAVNV